jgi:hypothetical protein
VPETPAELCTVPSEVHTIAIQIASDAVDLLLLATTTCAPSFGRTEVPVPEGTRLALESVVALRPRLLELRYIMPNVGTVTSEIVDVATDIVCRGC